jgi:tetratricopeptide (TPR) repeat protein
MPDDEMPIENTGARPRGKGRTLLLAVIVLAAGVGVWQSWDVWFKSDPTRPAVLAEFVHPGTAAQAVADCQQRLGRPDAALAALERFAEHHPSADVYMHMAEILSAQRRWDESEAKLRLVEQHDPKRGAVFMMRGDRYVSEERYQKAVAMYERAIALDPVRCGREVGEKLVAAKAHLDDVSRKEN